MLNNFRGVVSCLAGWTYTKLLDDSLTERRKVWRKFGCLHRVAQLFYNFIIFVKHLWRIPSNQIKAVYSWCLGIGGRPRCCWDFMVSLKKSDPLSHSWTNISLGEYEVLIFLCQGHMLQGCIIQSYHSSILCTLLVGWLWWWWRHLETKYFSLQ